MSHSIYVNFAEKYSANLYLLLRQRGSMLRGTVDEEDITGDKAFFERLGEASVQKTTSRHADTPLLEIPHTRRMCVIDQWATADLLDKRDKVRILIDPTNPYAEAQADALGQKLDDIIIAALGGTAYGGEDGTSGTALPSGQKVGHASAGMTVAKLRTARKLLLAAKVNPKIDKLYCGVTAAQLDNLLGTTEVTSADYNSVKALVQGDINTFLGFEFIHSEQFVTDASSNRLCYCWAKSGVRLGMGMEIQTKISERDDKNYSVQVWSAVDAGAVRMEEEKVVQIACVES